MQTSDPPGVDTARLTAFFTREIDPLDGRLQAEVIEGGRSNLTYVLQGRARRWVLRRPPLAHVLPTAHDMRREWRVTRALGPTRTPVPNALAFCEDPAVIGAPFYVMEYVDGHVVRRALPEGWDPVAATGAAMSAALVESLVALHAVIPASVGLEDFGRPEGFLERQVGRWWKQWEASKTRELPAMDELHRRLTSSLPPPGDGCIVHGDYRLDNLIFSPQDPGRIAAVVDWEMSTLGDPLCDVGLLLVYWMDDPADPTMGGLGGGGATLLPGFYSRTEVAADYARRSGRDLSRLGWYVALGGFKLAAIAEGIHARYLMGKTVGEGFERIGGLVPVLVEQAIAGLR
jgi:aminoglycoside phosphotransferase (APT) family kinase protein